MDSRYKKQYISQNTYLCKFGLLKNKTNYTCIKNNYQEDYQVGFPYNFTDVFVIKIPAINIAKEFINSGCNPVIATNVTEYFKDNNIDNLEGIFDDLTLIRTNYNNIMKMNNNYLPLNDHETLYTPGVIVLRDENLNLYNNEFFKIAMITNTIKIKEIEVTNNNNLTLSTYLKLKMKIENIFQTAHSAGHDVLILNDFNCTEYMRYSNYINSLSKKDEHKTINDNLQNFPVRDIIDIYNLCILKYGHLFKSIVFSFMIQNPKNIACHTIFLNKIIKPQFLNVQKEEDVLQKEVLKQIMDISKTI